MKTVKELISLELISSKYGWKVYKPSIHAKDADPLLTAISKGEKAIAYVDNPYICFVVFKNRKYFSYCYLKTPFRNYNKIQRMENKEVLKFFDEIPSGDIITDDDEFRIYKRWLMLEGMKSG